MQKRTHQFRESDLPLQFPGNWRVRKYDAHNFYKGFSGTGLKGVDFICITDQQQLLLIEVKNYRSHRNGGYRKNTAAALANPDELAERIHHKAEDTLEGIRAIARYYRSRWPWRRFIPLLRYLSSHNAPWRFWTDAADLALFPERTILHFYVATDPEDAYLISKMEERLKAYPKPEISEVMIRIINT